MPAALECPYCKAMTERIPGYRGRCAICLALYRILYRTQDGGCALIWYRPA